MIISQSFAKTMGLYGERTGAIHVVCGDKTTADNVLSQLKLLIRVNYSSPPTHGSRIAAMILNKPEMRNQWLGELKMVTTRMDSMRIALHQKLKDIGSKQNWDHIIT